MQTAFRLYLKASLIASTIAAIYLAGSFAMVLA